jgi:hypothetical protein
LEKQLASKKPADLLTEIVATIADERIAAADIGMAVDPQQGNAKRRDMEAEALIKVLGAGKGKGNPEEKKPVKGKGKGKKSGGADANESKGSGKGKSKNGGAPGEPGQTKKGAKGKSKGQKKVNTGKWNQPEPKGAKGKKLKESKRRKGWRQTKREERSQKRQTSAVVRAGERLLAGCSEADFLAAQHPQTAITCIPLPPQQ